MSSLVTLIVPAQNASTAVKRKSEFICPFEDLLCLRVLVYFLISINRVSSISDATISGHQTLTMTLVPTRLPLFQGFRPTLQGSIPDFPPGLLALLRSFASTGSVTASVSQVTLGFGALVSYPNCGNGTFD